MIVPDSILTCVAFVGSQRGEDEPVVKGTCFFAINPSRSVPNQGWAYAITARHVIDNIIHTGGKVKLRVNQSNEESQWIDCPDFWNSMPDNAVDVAVMDFDVRKYAHRCFGLQDCVGQPRALNWNPGIGDELFFPGLFTPHVGKRRNVPIVRTGHIAAMPGEKISAKFAPEVFRDIDAYLVETRSIGGFSGSPVFYYTGNAMRGGGITVSGSNYFLMGLMQGHFEVPEAVSDSVSFDEARINMGVGIVVPVDKILDTIASCFGEKERADEEAELARRASQP